MCLCVHVLCFLSDQDELESGDFPKSIQYYMVNDSNVTEEDAQEYIKSLISATWRKFE